MLHRLLPRHALKLLSAPLRGLHGHGDVRTLGVVAGGGRRAIFHQSERKGAGACGGNDTLLVWRVSPLV